MGENDDKGKKADTPISSKKVDEDLDLDEDLADALAGSSGGESTNIDNLIAIEDPNFSNELKNINAEDFAGVVITTEKSSDEINENEKAHSVFRTYLSNLPKEFKTKSYIALGILLLMTPIAALILSGKLLPRFDFPYVVSMNEITTDVFSYETDGVEVPLFDDFRAKSFTYELPKAKIILKTRDGEPATGDFEFFLNLRDEELSPTIDENQGEIRELIQNTLEEITWDELQTPLGKEKVKKVLRHRINELLQSNAILGVYYRSVILKK